MTERTVLFGREAELVRIADLVARHALVTLVGPGGIGKTRLALEMADRSRRDFLGGVFVVELAGSTEHDDIDSLVARQLGVSSVEAIHYRSRDHPILVVLDNCESVIRPAARLASRLVDGAPGARVLATSRTPLGEPGEHIVPVRPLDIPVEGDDVEARDHASVRMFFERSQRAGADLPVTEKVVDEVVALVRWLDGIPLAIELAAARTRVLSPSQLMERLADHLDLLCRPGDGNDRHRSIHAAIMTSYEPLSPAAQQAFRRLAVVPARFDLSLAHAVCFDAPATADDETLTVDLLTELIDTSLVEASTSSGSAASYRLLEPTRIFGRELLQHSGELSATTERYVDAMVDFATQIATEALEGFRVDTLARLRDHYVHLFHAIDWCIANDATAERANRLFLPLFGHSLPETVVRARRARATWPRPAPLHAEVLAITGAVAMHAGARALSRQWSDEALASAEGSRLARMIAFRTIGYLAAYSGDSARAQAHLQEAESIALGFSGAFSREIGLSRSALMTGPSEVEAGLALATDIARFAVESDELVMVHWAAVIQVSLLATQGRLDDAMQIAVRARSLAERTGHHWSASAGHRSVASVIAARDGWEASTGHFRLALESSLRHGDLAGASITLRAAAGALLRNGDRDGARQLWATIIDPAARSIVASLFAAEEHELEKERSPSASLDIAGAIRTARSSLGPGLDSPSNELGAAKANDEVLRFGNYELDGQLCELRCGAARVHLEPKVFDVLMYLAERRGVLVTKEELLDKVWGGRFVSESALATRIKAARRATGDDGAAQSVIRTVHGRGYTFVADVR